MEILGKKRENREETKSESSSSFSINLYSMLNNPDLSNYIKWDQDDKSIIIFNHNDFAKEILPKFYKTDRFSSFVKQLNEYGFKSIQTGIKNVKRFKNKQFNPTNLDEIKNIKKNYSDNDINLVEEESLDEETKIQNFQKILKNGKLSEGSLIEILFYLLEKIKEKNQKKNIERQNKNEHNNDLKIIKLNNNKLNVDTNQMHKMKGMILYLMRQKYELKNELNKKFVELINKYKIFKNENNTNNLTSLKLSLLNPDSNISNSSNSSNSANYQLNIMMCNNANFNNYLP